MIAQWGYKGRGSVDLRELTLAEYKAPARRAIMLDKNGQARDVRITSVKVWKTRPLDVTVGAKYGMYEYVCIRVREGKADYPLYYEASAINYTEAGSSPAVPPLEQAS